MAVIYNNSWKFLKGKNENELSLYLVFYWLMKFIISAYIQTSMYFALKYEAVVKSSRPGLLLKILTKDQPSYFKDFSKSGRKPSCMTLIG